jgi:hypothetical protein
VIPNQPMISRQEFMKRMEASSLPKVDPVRLPFIYTAMDEACFIQAEQILASIRRKNRPVIKRSFSEWAA